MERNRGSQGEQPLAGDAPAATAGGPIGMDDGDMLRLGLSGRPAPLVEPSHHFAELGVDIKVRAAVRPTLTRDGELPQVVSARPDDIVELTLQDGAHLWLRADEVEARFGLAASRSAATSVIELGRSLPLDERERGAGAWVIEGLRILGVDLPARGARAVAEAIEAKLVPAPGLYRWRGQAVVTADRVTAPLQKGDLPWLVFLHGTASHTMGSFGALPAGREIWKELERRYGERILALEHRTLTQSPIENARDLLQLLPADARLHLVSHSRGGLIGEMLCRGQLFAVQGDGLVARQGAFDEQEMALFGEDDRGGQRSALLKVGELLGTRRPRVERFVRVACPARGTSLAGDRLDRWLNLVTEVLGFAASQQPVLAEIHDLLSALVVAAVKERTDPRTLPGLEAMVPERSPLLRILNRPGVVADADLSIIKGDIEPSGVLRRLAVWFTDAYFAGDHDLVVDSPSMDGGLPRKTPARVYFDRGADVDHFSYFRNSRTAKRVVAALLREAPDEADFKTLVVAADAARGKPVLATRGARARPVVFVLPGITGSHLRSGSSRIWVDLVQLAAGGLKRLGIDRADITADEPIWRYYADLCTHLDQTHEVRPWGYDWRRPIEDATDVFADALDEALTSTEQPVRIVAHSMGGLVARAALAKGDIFRRFRERAGSRLVMLGTPNGGSYSIPMMLMARNTLMARLAILDFTMRRRDHQEIIARFGGALAMLPAEDQALFTAARWSELHRVDPERADWIPPRAADLEQAFEFRKKLEVAPLDPERMFYIAGQAATIVGLDVDERRLGESVIMFNRTREGDGQVLWKTGIPAGIRAWYTPAAHGDLARYTPAFPAIQDLLELGRTTRLPTEPAALTRSSTEPGPIARERAPVFPGEAELVLGAASDATPLASSRETLPRVTMSVMNGDLSFASHAVLVGHYTGDTLAGTEEHVDRALKGRLRHRYNLGIYPGPIGTADVVLDPQVKPPGAVVMGLGNITELTPGRLRDALVRGLTTYAAAADEALAPPTAPASERRLSVSPVLIGSGEGGLSIDDTVAALLNAVLETQRRLQQSGGPVFGRVQVVELVEERALRIWRALHRLLGFPEFQAAFDLEPEVKVTRGSRRRLPLPDDRSWWRTVQITAGTQPEGEESLKFVAIAGRARAEASMVSDNRALADLLVSQSTEGATAEGGGASPARAMFELLWPNTLKESNTDDSNLRLVLDQQTARYPWELMDDRRPWLIRKGGPDMSARKPPAARFGVLRQLINENYRIVGASAASGRKALVIGDPRGGTPARGFAPLPGARAEAIAVAKLLQGRGFEVTDLATNSDQVTPDIVIRHLLTEAWSIVHVAAHGVVRHRFTTVDKTPGLEQTGIVLGEGVVLGPSLLNQMPVTPDLFFVNCCHLAKPNDGTRAEHQLERRPELAASVAVQLIAMGCRAVVAAGWAVDDDAAALFARSLYEQLLGGSAYGSAVRGARERTYDAHMRSTTWGAYQCYGEPDWRLDPRSTRAASEHPVHYAAPVEALVEVEQIRDMSNVGTGRDAEAMAARLRDIEEAIKARGWLSRADLRAALGEAHAELGHVDEAIAHYEASLREEEAQAPVRTIEQVANLRIRQIGRVDPGRKAECEAAISTIDRARSQLERLTELAGATMERLSLQGGAWKRRAQLVEREEDREEALRRMGTCYEQAFELARKSGLRNAYYAGLMQGTAELVLVLRANADVPEKLREHFATLCQELQNSAGESDDFWRAVALPDARLCLALAEKRLDARQEATVVAAYEAAWRAAGSDLKLGSVIEHYAFLEALLGEGDVRAALGRIRTSLEATRKRGIDGAPSGQCLDW